MKTAEQKDLHKKNGSDTGLNGSERQVNAGRGDDHQDAEHQE
ncbi:MAG TPA: hypothetical protein VGR48_00765 [Terriglobales bacterium]|nr:hypothetical protein [Terriglobales bacterium]